MKKFLAVVVALVLSVSSVFAYSNDDFEGETFVLYSMGEYSGETLSYVLSMAGLSLESFFKIEFINDEECTFTMNGEDLGTVEYAVSKGTLTVFDPEDSSGTLEFSIQDDGDELSVYVPGTGDMVLRKSGSSSVSKLYEDAYTEVLQNYIDAYSDLYDYYY